MRAACRSPRRPGPCKLNQNSQGSRSSSAGRATPRGWAFAGNSSTTIALNGQYSRFDSTIGVDGTARPRSSVIFQVYGDGSLLYQSPIVAYASAAVPIDVNVAGVQKLTLVVVAAPGSTAANDHAVWADARLISTANFGSTTALHPDLAALAERPGPVHADRRFLRLRRPVGDLHADLDRHRRPGRQGHGQHDRDGGPRRPDGVADPERYRRRRATGSATTAPRAMTSSAKACRLPSYATVAVSGATTYDLGGHHDRPRGLREPDGVGAAAAAWYRDQLHDRREPERRPGARPGPLRGRLGPTRGGASRSRSSTPPPAPCWTPRPSRRSPAGRTCSGPSAATWRSR